MTLSLIVSVHFMQRTMPSAVEAGCESDFPAGPKRADSGGRPRHLGGGSGGDGRGGSSLDTLVSRVVPYSSSPDDNAELHEADGGGGWLCVLCFRCFQFSSRSYYNFAGGIYDMCNLYMVDLF